MLLRVTTFLMIFYSAFANSIYLQNQYQPQLLQQQQSYAHANNYQTGTTHAPQYQPLPSFQNQAEYQSYILPPSTGQKCSERMPHPTIPTKFIMCLPDGDFVVMDCPDDLVFNKYLDRCDYDANPVNSGCSSNPCNNNGQCNDLGNLEYNCECNDGFTGLYCETNADPQTTQSYYSYQPQTTTQSYTQPTPATTSARQQAYYYQQPAQQAAATTAASQQAYYYSQPARPTPATTPLPQQAYYYQQPAYNSYQPYYQAQRQTYNYLPQYQNQIPT